MLEITDLKINYGSFTVIEKLNLSAQLGEIHGILGMNGAGKTSFFNCLYGFHPSEKGKLLFNNRTLQKADIAYFETHNFFYSYMKGGEYLDLFSMNHPNFQKEKWNEIFELPLNDVIDTYSTGMKKKLAFLGIIALNRPILVLDEPFNGIDLESHEKIVQILYRLKSKGKLILISSHIIQSLTSICDRISFLNNKRIERTFVKNEMNELSKILKGKIVNKISNTLDELL